MMCACTGACLKPPYTCYGGPAPLAGTDNTSGTVTWPPTYYPTVPNTLPQINPNPQLGWKCPSCQSIYSPYVQKCLNMNCSPPYSANNVFW